MLPLLAEKAVTGIERKQQGNTGYYAAPSDTYRTRDGWILVPTIGNQMFRRWARLVGRPDLIDDPLCVDDITRANNYEVINEAMARWCAERTRDEAIADLEGARIPCGPVYNLGEVLADPQVKARGLIGEVYYPGSDKPVPITPTPVGLSQTPGSVRRRAPTLGEQTDEVLSELGFSTNEIARLREAGAI